MARMMTPVRRTSPRRSRSDRRVYLPRPNGLELLRELVNSARTRDIARVHAGRTEEVLRVIERHQDHDRAAQKVGRIDARADGD
jgi:hypothetical protein